MNISPRILKEAKAQASLQAGRIKSAYSQGRLKSWTNVEQFARIKIANTFTTLPFNYSSLLSFLQYWENSVEARLDAEVSIAPAAKIEVQKVVTTFHNITLYPEQQGCFEAMYKAFNLNDINAPGSIRAALQDGYTGSGKTFIAAALIAQAVKDGILEHPDVKYRLHPFMIVCPNGVAESWRRVIESFGLGDLLKSRKILVFNDSQFGTIYGKMFVSEQDDPVTGDTVIQWNSMFVPIFTIIDEYHRFVNPKTYRTKCLLALLKTKPKKFFLCMSATPMEKVNDSYLFTLACDRTFMGIHVNEDTFKMFAQLIDKEPHRPNREALKRLRSVLQSNIFSIPYVKPKFKAVNMVWLVDFWRPQDQAIYESAHARYIEACRKSGKNTAFGRFEKFIALNNYRKTVEPLRAPHMAMRTAENYKSGAKATAIFAAHKETLTNIAFDLVDNYKIPREHIAIVWGGKKEYRPQDLLTMEELDRLLKSGDASVLMNNPTLLKRVRITLRYVQDKHEHSETSEQQTYRHARLRELRLTGKQSENARQIEVDRYQDGSARIVLATIATGGVGLSFDRNKPSLLPREGLFTPIYSGKEFQQALGRLVRRASLSDADQYICMMRGTVEEWHVAPILDEKLKCIAEITNRAFDIIELLNQDAPAVLSHIKVRSKDLAAQDAEKDNTIVADLHADTDEDEDEEDDTII